MLNLATELINLIGQSALADGKHVVVDIDGADVAVFKLDGQFYSI